MTFVDIFLRYICPSIGCLMASVMFAGKKEMTAVHWYTAMVV